MTEGLQGVLIGGVIGIVGSIVVETLRARQHRVQTQREHFIDILNKRKAALISILEHFRKLQFDLVTIKAHPEKLFDKSQFDCFTGFMPHLAILPEPFPSFVRSRVDLLAENLWGNNSPNIQTDAPVNVNSPAKIFAKYTAEVIKRATNEIALIDAEIMGVKKTATSDPAGKVNDKIDGQA